MGPGLVQRCRLRAASVAPVRVVVLVSGSGTLLQALLDADTRQQAVEVVAVGADRAGTAGLERASARGVPTFVVDPAGHADRSAWDGALAATIADFAPDLVVSAGFMRILRPVVLAGAPVLNMHPALLPSFPGAHAVRDALAYGVQLTGTTCHWVDAGVDTGPIIAQEVVAVRPDDDETTLHERIKVVERALLVEVVADLAAGRRSWPQR